METKDGPDNPAASKGVAAVDNLTEEEKQVIELLRTPKLSIKYLDEDRKEKVRRFFQHWYIEKGLSQGDIAKLIGNKTSGYVSWTAKQLGILARDFEEARLKGIHEKVRKYERKPFDGTDEDKAYLLSLRHSDLSASIPFGDAIRVSTSTTHPAMIQLFTGLFSPYGHVYKHPREKKEMHSFEWNLSTILDNSFAFLLQNFQQVKPWIDEDERRMFSYLSGFLDAEGSIVTTKDQSGKVALFLDYNNSNRAILEWIEMHVKRLGYYCSIRINKRRGDKTKKYGIIHNSDYWQLSVYGMRNVKDLIAKLKPRHSEKIRRQALALSTWKGQDYAFIASQVESLRSEIKKEIQQSILEAEQEYKAKHGC